MVFMSIDPRPAGDIRNAVVIATQPRRFFQPLVQHVIEPLRLDLEAFDGVGDRRGAKWLKWVF